MREGENQHRMRRGVVFSAILHVLVLALVVFGLPRWHKPVEIAPAIPVEVVTLTEKPAAPKAEPKPQPVKLEPPKPEVPPAPPPPPAAQPEPEPAPVPEPKEVAALPPQPEPEPVPVPEPAPKPKPEPEVKKPEPPKPEPPKPVAKPKPPTPKPIQEAKKPEEKPAEPPQPSFLKNIDKWKASTQTASTEPPKQQPAPQPTAQPSSVQDQLSRNELSELIRRKVESCWNVPAGARDAGDLLVEIKVVLNRDGSVVSADIVDAARASSDTFYRAAAESARRAVRTCSPFNELPADRYDIWQTLTLRFNPKEMLGT